VKPSVLLHTEVCKMGYIDALKWVVLFLLYLNFILLFPYCYSKAVVITLHRKIFLKTKILVRLNSSTVQIAQLKIKDTIKRKKYSCKKQLYTPQDKYVRKHHLSPILFLNDA